MRSWNEMKGRLVVLTLAAIFGVAMAAGCAANTEQAAQVTPIATPSVDSQKVGQQPNNQSWVLIVNPTDRQIEADHRGYKDARIEDDGRSISANGRSCEIRNKDGNVMSLTDDGGGAVEMPPVTVTNNYNTTIGDVTISGSSTQNLDDQSNLDTKVAGDQKTGDGTSQKVDPNVSANLQATNASAGGNASPNATGSAGSPGATTSEQKTDAAMQTVLNEIKAQNDTLAKLVEALKPQAEMGPPAPQASGSTEAETEEEETDGG